MAFEAGRKLSQGEFEDRTDPAERSFGFYATRVRVRDYDHMIRASHATATRVARSKTRWGDTRLDFIEAIDTPALD